MKFTRIDTFLDFVTWLGSLGYQASLDKCNNFVKKITEKRHISDYKVIMHITDNIIILTFINKELQYSLELGA